MEGEVIDYTFLLNDIIDRLDEIIVLLGKLEGGVESIQSHIVPIISGLWTLVTIVVPLVGLIAFLWFFFKQFIYNY